MKMLPHFVWNYIDTTSFFVKKMLYRRKKLSKKDCKPLKVLVLANKAGIGNAIQATPLVQAIRMLWPSCQLTFMPPTVDLFGGWCVPDRVIANRKVVEGEHFDYTFAAYLYEDLDVYKELFGLGRVNALNKWQKKWFLKPEREYYVKMLKSYGYKGGTPPCYVNIKRPEKVLHGTGFRICIAPCGKNDDLWKHKKWPHYPELIDMLRDQYPNAQVCIIGTTEDNIDIEFDGQNIVDCRSVYSLSETAWLLKHSDLVIGNDCGPMHIASTVNVPSVVIFGPTCIIKNAYAGKTSMIYPEDLECWPCQYNAAHMQACTSGECINSIRPEKVLELSKKSLSLKCGIYV